MKKNPKDAFRTISLSREMDNVIQRIAAERDCSVSALIRQAVRVTFAKEIAAWREILSERQRGKDTAIDNVIKSVIYYSL